MRIEIFITGLSVALVSAALLCASSLPAEKCKEAPKKVNKPVLQQVQLEPDPYAGMSDEERMRGVVLEPVEK